MATPKLLTFFQDFTTDALGQISLTGIVSVKDYSHVDLQIVQYPTNVPNLVVKVYMGKISGTTLSQIIDTFPLGVGGSPVIRPHTVVGPEVNVVITGGPPTTKVSLQAWVFLH